VFVIVYGALRSGTTLLRLMMDMHPQLDCPGETDFLFDYLRFDADGQGTIDADALARNRIYQASPARLNPDLRGEAAIRDMIEQLRQNPEARVVLMLHRGLEKALRLFPGTPVLHMLRDPRDVARSSIGMGWAGTVYHGVQHWIKTEREWDRVVAAHPQGNFMPLRYEDLITQPKVELERLANAFGVPFDVAMLDYHQNSTYAPPDTSLVEQWKRKQTPQEVALVEGRLGAMLTDRGYAPSGHAPVTPQGAERAALWLRDKQAVWKTRIGRYGVIDPVLVGLAKRLRIPPLGYAAQQRINRKTVKYLK